MPGKPEGYKPDSEELAKAESIMAEDSGMYPNRGLERSSRLREQAVGNVKIFSEEGFPETGKELLNANEDFDRSRRFFEKLEAPLAMVRNMISDGKETPESVIEDVNALFEEAREVRQSLARYGIHFTMEPLRTALYGFNSRDRIGVPEGHDNDVGWISEQPPTIEEVEKEFVRLEEYTRWLNNLQEFSRIIGKKFTVEAGSE